MATLLIDLTGFVPNKNYGAQAFVLCLFDAFKVNSDYKKIVICSKACKEFLGSTDYFQYKLVMLPSNFIIRSIFAFFYLNYFNFKLKPQKIFYPLNINYTSGDKVYTYLHDLVCLYYIKNYRLKYSLKYYILYLKYKLQFSKKTNIAVPSSFIKNQFINTFNTKIRPFVIREGRVLNIIESPDVAVKNKKVFLVNSLNAKHKNISDLINALHLLQNENLKFDIEFKFTGNLNQKIKGFIQDFSHNKIKLTPTGYLTYKQIASEIKACTAIIFCTNYEGFGIPVLEAMESSKPIICSDIEVLREFNYNGQYFYKNNHPQTLKNQIIEVGKQNNIVVSSKSQLEEYNWNNIVNWVLNNG